MQAHGQELFVLFITLASVSLPTYMRGAHLLNKDRAGRKRDAPAPAQNPTFPGLAPPPDHVPIQNSNSFICFQILKIYGDVISISPTFPYLQFLCS